MKVLNDVILKNATIKRTRVCLALSRIPHTKQNKTKKQQKNKNSKNENKTEQKKQQKIKETNKKLSPALFCCFVCRSFDFMGLGDYILYSNTKRHFQVRNCLSGIFRSDDNFDNNITVAGCMLVVVPTSTSFNRNSKSLHDVGNLN